MLCCVEIFMGQSFSGMLCDIWSMGVILFISLTGVPPYQLPATSDQRFGLIFTGQLNRLLQAWKMNDWFSDEVKDLMSHMLCKQEQRFNIQQVLNHSWVKNANV